MDTRLQGADAVAASSGGEGAAGSGGLSKARVEALCDGVFAIAMTLMVFNIKVPEVAAGALGGALLGLGPEFLVYGISFVMLGVYWIGHHAQFHYIRRTNRALLWLNVVFLLLVAVIPFSTGVLGRYPGERAAVALYAGNLIGVGLMLYAQWRYATRGGRLVDADLDARVIRMASRRTLLGPAVLAVAIGMAWINTGISIAICAAVPVFYIVPGRIDRHWRLT